MLTDPRPSLLPVAATLLALAGIRDGETVVDAGCGAGLLTHPAAAATGARGVAYGVDLDAAVLVTARDRRESPRARWVRAYVGRLPFADGTVDKVISGSLHDLDDVVPVLAEYARILVSGGRVVVSAWGSFAESAGEDAVARALEEAGDGTYGRAVGVVAGGTPRDAADLPDLLRETGLRVVYRTEDGVALTFPDGESYATWRLSFPRARTRSTPDVVRRVADLLGTEPVLVHARVHFATATTTA